MSPSMKNVAADLESQNRLLNKIYEEYEQGYLQYLTESENIVYWVSVIIARLVMAKMTLIVFLPVLFSSPSEHFSDEIRTKLLVSAIEVAEYNHELNAEQACRQWRWVYQTYTHWYAIVYLLIEVSRRPWSPIIERAWVALHSSWLIPAQNSTNQNLRIWVPIKKLMAKASKYRDVELSRLRADPQAAAKLDMEDQKIPLPSSSGPFRTGSSADIFRERWRQLVDLPARHGKGTQISEDSSAGLVNPPMRTKYTRKPTARSISAYGSGAPSSNITSEPTYFDTSGQSGEQTLKYTNIRDPEPVTTANIPKESILKQTVHPSYDTFPTIPADLADGGNMESGFVPWLWANDVPLSDGFHNLDMDSIDIDMDLDGEVNWYDWVESAKDIESDAMLTGNGRT
jgi:hypothetical protein